MTEAQRQSDGNSPLNAWLDTHEEDLIELTLDLIGIDSQNPPGDTDAIVAYIEEFVRELDIECNRVVESKPNVLFTVAVRPAVAT